jgi:catechol 2,3-dioxygenase-like lactoylglutathione lyase family enzyme
MATPSIGSLHHLELWVPDIARGIAEWGWLLGAIGYQPFQDWPGGRSWKLGDAYIVIEQSPDMVGNQQDRHRPGMNHVAFHAGNSAKVDELTSAAPDRGWTLLFPDLHPHAGGSDTYAAYLANTDGYEVELIAADPGSEQVA